MKLRIKLKMGALLLVAGCVLDQAWEDRVEVINPYDQIHGRFTTVPELEGNHSGCTVGTPERVERGRFEGEGAWEVVVHTESETEREDLVLLLMCVGDPFPSLEGDDDDDDVASLPSRSFRFSLNDQDPLVITLDEAMIPDCDP